MCASAPGSLPGWLPPSPRKWRKKRGKRRTVGEGSCLGKCGYRSERLIGHAPINEDGSIEGKEGVRGRLEGIGGCKVIRWIKGILLASTNEKE